MINNDTDTYKQLLGQQSGDTTSFDAVSISVASPETIRSWSHGEIKNPETINYRSFKPEKGGLFCERIFGPTRDWECNCGKYKRVKHKDIVCDRCGVKVTQSKVRRERMGHIDLAIPVSHIWFFKCMPSRIALMLDITPKKLEKIIYYEDWVVTDAGDTPLQICQSLTEIEYRQAREDYGDSFEADMGALAIRELLENLDLENVKIKLKEELTKTKNKAIRKKLAKRLRLAEGFLDGDIRPEWMIMEVLPVIPPDLRPLVPLEGGRFATSDLNDLYRRVINRNNRLKNLLQLRTPDVIIRNEKRMLQEAVDALLDNGRHGRTVTAAGNRPLKSLSEMLKGKQGRFRQNLLGKRVDYSGRSVIVVGPELELGQCGLPKKMALALFEPFVIRHLKGRNYAHTVRGAKKMIEREEPVVWDILEEITTGHPVMLNRAPTLHRLSIQAFDPVLIEGSAIRLHPLVCTAYNADFDGDQMAVHVPLSSAAQIETKLLMSAPNNIFSPSNGKPITTPTQDITLGVYYLTLNPPTEDGAKVKQYSSVAEMFNAFDMGTLKIHDAVRIANPDLDKDTLWGDKTQRYITTTLGRCIFNEIWDESLGFVNNIIKKKGLGLMIWEMYSHIGHEKTVKLLDELKNLGYKYATIAGFSISTSDMIIPENKPEFIEKARKEISKIVAQYNKGTLTDGERYNKIIETWTKTSADVAKELFSYLEKNLKDSEHINPIFAMLDSGARGSKDQIRQLAGMRGLMAKPSGEIIERPIIASFREGLSVLEYFISSHGARKGLADTALKTADSGYMTRKLVDVAQDIICKADDCGTIKGVSLGHIYEGDDIVFPLEDRVVGRFTAEDIKNLNGDVIIPANQLITIQDSKKIRDAEITKIVVRSPLMCEIEHGICIKCYGTNLANNKMVKQGDAVGIIAAQSIGEPGTQLTMRTFHIGGTASSSYKDPVINARHSGKLKFEGVRTIVNEDKEIVVVNQNGYALILDPKGNELDHYSLEVGAVLSKKDGNKIKKKELLATWDQHNVPIIAEESGLIEYLDLVEGVTFSKTKRGKLEEILVMAHREDLHPQLLIKDEDGEVLAHYPLPAGALIMIGESKIVNIGTTIARVPRQTAKNKDITGGLPRVSELFEARIPKDIAEIAKIDGVIEIGKSTRGKRKIIVHDKKSNQEEVHTVPIGKHLIVGKGDFVRKGNKLTDGAFLLQDLLDVCGVQILQKYIVDEVQQVYLAQGVEINDKHIEMIISQMLQKVIISDPGTTMHLTGEQIDKYDFNKGNEKIIATGGTPAEATPILLGITKSSLATESFLSSASFQDTTRILTEAATLGKVDKLKGLKENVITGHLIPVGTGRAECQNIKLKYLGEEIEIDPLENQQQIDPLQDLEGMDALQTLMNDIDTEDVTIN